MAKRKNTTTSEPANARQKRQKKAEPVDPNVKKVENIVAALEQFHENNKLKSILVDACKVCFSEPKETRHVFESNFIEMINQTVTELAAEEKMQVDTAQKEFENADEAKAKNLIIKAELADAVEKKKEEISAKDQVVTDAVVTVKRVMKELKTKKTDMTQACQGLKIFELELEDTEDIYTIFKACRDVADKSKEGKKKVASIVSFLKKKEVDDSLAIGANAALLKEERGAFDNIVVQSISEKFESIISKLNADIQAEKEANKGVIEAVDQSQKECDVAKEVQEKEEAAVEALQKEEQEFTKKKKSVEKDIKDHAKNVKIVCDNLDAHAANLTQLQEVAAEITQLRERSNVEPEIVEVPIIVEDELEKEDVVMDVEQDVVKSCASSPKTPMRSPRNSIGFYQKEQYENEGKSPQKSPKYCR